MRKLLIGLLSLVCCGSYALKLKLPKSGDDLVGRLSSATVQKGQDLAQIAREHDLGYFELIEANPHINPKNLKPGTELILPTQYILPSVPHNGIVINLSTMRLYYFPMGKNYFYTYPVGIGKKHWSTPVGKFKIMQKVKDPVWIVPKSIYQHRLKEGDPVPKVVQPGPTNPLGHYALRLSNPTYLIHGTNNPASVGVRSSAGCIHLYPEDIKALYEMVNLGTPVTIISKPYLFGWHGKSLYLDAHLPLAEQRANLDDISQQMDAFAANSDSAGIQIDRESVKGTISAHLGVPMEIGEMRVAR